MPREILLTVDDAAQWRALLPASANVFGSVEYAQIVQEQTGHHARLFVADDGRVVYPFFLRPVHTLPFAKGLPAPLWDAVSPEYSGPRTGTAVGQPTAAGFADQFSAWCQKHGVVAEFIHLHPLDPHLELLDSACISLDREIVYVDLTLPEEVLWREALTHSCSRNIARSQRRGVRVFRATTAEHVREFHRVYTLTMEHNQALKKYHFPLQYFLAFFERMPDHALFLLAEYEGRVIAGGLYLCDDADVYGHLAGSDRSYHALCAANAEVWEAIRWARQQGKKRLILGGGYAGQDGVFRFKAGFSRLRANFQISRRVHLPDLYADLCRAWAAFHHAEPPATGFFPAYRAVSP